MQEKNLTYYQNKDNAIKASNPNPVNSPLAPKLRAALVCVVPGGSLPPCTPARSKSWVRASGAKHPKLTGTDALATVYGIDVEEELDEEYGVAAQMGTWFGSEPITQAWVTQVGVSDDEAGVLHWASWFEMQARSPADKVVSYG